MSNHQEIIILECRIKDIFKKDVITDVDVFIANRLIEKWKKLTNYKEEDSSEIETTIEKRPFWHKDNKLWN